jgi:hypothetical protein
VSAGYIGAEQFGYRSQPPLSKARAFEFQFDWTIVRAFDGVFLTIAQHDL